MSNLVPTLRIDKNGKAVVRHMKPRENNQPAALSMAPPSPQSGDVPQTMSNREFIKSLFYNGSAAGHPDYYKEALEALQKDSPNVVPDTLRLLNLGDAEGSKSAIEYLRKNLYELRLRIRDRDVDDDWMRVDDLAPATRSLNEAMVISWSIGSLRSVAEEYAGDDAELRQEAVNVHWFINGSKQLNMDISDASYWRATGAATIIVHGRHSEVRDKQQTRQLIEWLETEDQRLGDIIRISKERGLLDAESLKAILYSEGHSSLESGVL